jgi:hypothetical protein
VSGSPKAHRKGAEPNTDYSETGRDQAMRDTTQWCKDADRLRRRLMDAYRAGDINAIAHATQALEILLERADRPPHPAGNARSGVGSLARPARQGRDTLTFNRGSRQRPSEMSSCSKLPALVSHAE